MYVEVYEHLAEFLTKQVSIISGKAQSGLEIEGKGYTMDEFLYFMGDLPTRLEESRRIYVSRNAWKTKQIKEMEKDSKRAKGIILYVFKSWLASNKLWKLMEDRNRTFEVNDALVR
jgi:hypothetical protein